MDKQKDIAIKFLQWVKKSCTTRNTSRNNVWSIYWQLKSTGLLYSDEELFDYWIINIKDNV